MLIRGIIDASNAVTVYATIVDQSGNPITQSEISSVSYTVTDEDAQTVTLTSTASPSNVIFNSYQSVPTCPQYNFALYVDASAFSTSGDTYLVDVLLTPVAGDPYHVKALLQTR